MGRFLSLPWAFLHYYTMIIVRYAGFEPGAAAPEIWCATKEPPHLHFSQYYCYIYEQAKFKQIWLISPSPLVACGRRADTSSGTSCPEYTPERGFRPEFIPERTDWLDDSPEVGVEWGVCP